MNRIQYLIKNTLIFALGTVGTKLINFLLVPLYTNVLLKSEYGTVDLAFTLGTFLVPLLILNINEAILRFSLDKGADQNKILSVGFASLGFMLVASGCAYPLLRLYPPIAEYAPLVLLYFISSGTSTVFMYHLRGKEMLLRFSVGNILNTLFVAGLNIVFLTVLSLGVKGYFLAYIIANGVTAVYAFFAGNAASALGHFSIDRGLLGQMLRYSLVLIPNSFMWWVMDSSDRVMLTSMVGLSVTGMYAIAGKLPSIVSVISSVFNQAWNYSAIKEQESADSAAYHSSVFDKLFLSVVTVGSGILLILKPFMSVYVEASYYDAWRYTPPLIVGTVILVLSTFLSSSYTVNKDSKGFLFSALSGAVVNILLNLALIPLWGALGAAIATCVAYATVFLYRFFDTKKYLRLRVFTLKHILLFLAFLGAAFATYLGKVGYLILGAELLLVLSVFGYSFWKSLRKRSA